MADINTEIDKQSDLTTITVNGSLTAEDINEAIRNFYNHPTRLVLWLANHCQLDDLSPLELEEASKLISQVKTEHSEGKTAFVLGTNDFGLGVLFETFTRIEHLPREYRSFTSIDEAMRWLTQA